MYISEVSNAFMHVRIMLKQYGLRYTKLYETMEISFMLLYIWGRFILGSSVVYNTVSCTENNWIVRLASAALMVQSLYFIKQMYGILKKRFQEINDRKRLRIQAYWLKPLTEEKL